MRKKEEEKRAKKKYLRPKGEMRYRPKILKKKTAAYRKKYEEDGSITTVLVGGLMEPHGYGSSPPVSALPSNETTGIVQVVNEAPNPFYLQRAIAHSSFAPGAWVDHFSPHFSDYVVDYMNYWSVDDNREPVKNNTFLIADGGVLDNIGLGMSLRRRIDRIVLFENSGTPLVSREQWDPSKKAPTPDYISADILSYFGYNYDTAGQDFSHNHYFNTSDFVSVAMGLQDAQAKGNGAVYTTKLTTIANAYWQIPAGLEITVTFYHLGRAYNWEKLLSSDLKKQVTPQSGNYSDPTNVIKSGAFKNFPFFGTFSQLEMSACQVNLLSHMTTWVVEQNPEHFWFDVAPSAEKLRKIVADREERANGGPGVIVSAARKFNKAWDSAKGWVSGLFYDEEGSLVSRESVKSDVSVEGDHEVVSY